MRLFPALLLLPTLLCAQEWFHTGQRADRMLSGRGFNDAGGALLFHHPSGLASDGSRLLLCDRFNNRILVWNAAPARWDAPPDFVLGQKTLSSNNPGTGKDGLNWPGNASLSQDGVLAVADTENDRILLWTRPLAENAQAADVAISLPAISPPQRRYAWPWGVWTDGRRLAAVATQGSTLLFWNTLPLRDDQPPDYTITLPEFGTPRNISSDGATYFFVGDHNAKVARGVPSTFFWNGWPARQDQPFDFSLPGWMKGTVLRDGSCVAAGMFTVSVWNAIPRDSTAQPSFVLANPFYSNGDGPDVVMADGRMYVCNYNGNNVQVFNTVPTSNRDPDFALGSPSIDHNTLSDLHYIQNPVVASDGRVLLASSDFDRTVWIWKTADPTMGQAADVRISLQGRDIFPWDNALHGGRLVLAGKNRVAVWDALPLNGEAPSYTISNHLGSFEFRELKGVALDSMYFYLADADGRIGMWRGLPRSADAEPFLVFRAPASPLNHLHSDGTWLCAAAHTGATAVYVHRVADLAAQRTIPYRTITRTAQLPLNLASGAITFGGSLAVANTSGNAVYLWKNIDDVPDPSRAVVLGQSSVSETEPGIGDDRLFMPASLCMLGNDLWVGELKFSSRILRFRSGITGVIDTEPDPATTLHFQTVAPNPARDLLTAQLSYDGHETVAVSLVDALGRVVDRVVLSSGVSDPIFRFSIGHLPAGVYHLQAFSASSRVVRAVVIGGR